MFKEYFNLFNNEVYQATGSYVIWKNLQNLPADDSVLLDSLNATPISWIFIRHSMMLSLIMTLSRIFDTDSDAISIDDLIKSCILDIDVFSKNSLRDRKLQGSGNAESWIDDYIDNAYEPEAKDFQMLKPDIKKYRKMYQEIYKPIRNKIFAHSDKEYSTKTGELWASTKDGNIEELLNFLEDLKITLRETYDNGRKPTLQQRTIDEDWFNSDITLLLENIKSYNQAINSN